MTLADEDPQQAIAIAKTALDINPSDVAVHVFLAGEAADAGRRDEARKSLGKYLELSPKAEGAGEVKEMIAALGKS